MPREITSDELTALRTDGQWSRLYLAILNPATVYTARVNGTPSDLDRLASIEYDGGSGTLANVLPGMTLWVGSSAGASDRGQARIRKAPDSDTFFIGETSELNVADNDYLTVVNEFAPWARHVRVVDNVPYMDYEVAYADQHATRAPVAVLGSHQVLWLRGAAVSAAFDASDSWEPGGASLTYLWTAPGASATSGLTTATPTITYNAAGAYRVGCTVSNGAAATIGYRTVFVFSDASLPITQFTVDQMPSGAEADGGWGFQVTLYDEAALTTVRDRALAILFAVDHYDGERASYGYAAGRENILAVGWIAGETLNWGAELSSVSFAVEGLHSWLARLPAFPQGLEDATGAPAAWTQYQDLNFTAAMWHLLVWRSTLASIADCYVEDNDWRAVEFVAPATSLWEQISVMAYGAILARPVTDHLGRLFIERDAQLLSDRSAVPEVITLTTADLQDDTAIQRLPLSVAALVDLSGVAWDGSAASAYFALSPGHVFKRHGQVEVIDRLVVPDQATALELAGLLAGKLNNPYSTIPLRLAGNYRFFDVAPALYINFDMAAGATPRGLALSLRLLPRRVSYAFDPETGCLTTELECEAETFEQLSAIGDAPATEPPDDPEPPDPPDPEEPEPGTEATGDLVYVATVSKLGRTRNFLDASPDWEDITPSVSGDIVAFEVDPWDPNNRALIIATGGVYRTTDLDESPPTFTLILAPTTVQTAVGKNGVEFRNCCYTITQDGKIYVGWRAYTTGSSGVRGAFGVSTSSDGGATWTQVHIDNNTGTAVADAVIPRMIGGLSGVGLAYLTVGNKGSRNHLCYTTTGGASWVLGWYPGLLQSINDFELAYPDAAATVIVLRNSEEALYSHGGFGGTFTQAQDFGGSGASRINGHVINIATTDRDDILILQPATGGSEGECRFFHSTDRGLNYTEIYSADYGNSPDIHGTPIAVSNGRWPYDPERVFWLSNDTDGDGHIWYTDDLFDNVDDKTGDWAAVFGANLTRAVRIIPIWLNP